MHLNHQAVQSVQQVFPFTSFPKPFTLGQEMKLAKFKDDKQKPLLRRTLCDFLFVSIGNERFSNFGSLHSFISINLTDMQPHQSKSRTQPCVYFASLFGSMSMRILLMIESSNPLIPMPRKLSHILAGFCINVQNRCEIDMLLKLLQNLICKQA